MDITNLLQWLIPSGGLGAVLVWLTNKTLRNLRTTKEVHDTYKLLYENIRETLIELQNENNKLYKSISRLERVISRAPACKYYASCPISGELQHNQADIANPKQRNKGQSRNKGNTGSDSCDSTGVESTANDPDGKPP